MSNSAGQVAVLLCTRDRPEMLERCLQQLEAVLDSAVEVVIVDSASREHSTQDVISKTRFNYLRSEVPGLTIARNVALRAAHAEIVVFIDDDCLPEPGWLEPLISAFDDDLVGAVTGLMAEEGAEPNAQGFPPARLTQVWQGLDGGHGAVMAMRRHLVLDLGGFDEVLGAGRPLAGADDLDIFCRIIGAGFAVVREPRSVVRHAHTRNDPDHRKLYFGYGLGLGAMTAKWWRTSVRDGAMITAVQGKRWITSLLRMVKSGPNSRRSRADRAFYAGAVKVSWLAYGFRWSDLTLLTATRQHL